MKNYNRNSSHANRIGSGLILLVIGTVFLLKNFGVLIPDWVFSWNVLIIVIGLAIGIRRRFHGSGWLLMIMVGTYFTLRDVVDLDISKYCIGAALVILGLFLILKPHNVRNEASRARRAMWKEKWRKQAEDFKAGGGDYADFKKADFYGAEDNRGHENDYVEAINVFGGSKQQVYAKNFKGGDVISVFGGCELNLLQADFEKTVTLDVVAVFGGIKLIIPPNWIVKSEVVPIFGGIDDKRTVLTPADEESQKIIKIEGVALFGGLSITNY